MLYQRLGRLWWQSAASWQLQQACLKQSVPVARAFPEEENWLEDELLLHCPQIVAPVQQISVKLTCWQIIMWKTLSYISTFAFKLHKGSEDLPASARHMRALHLALPSAKAEWVLQKRECRILEIAKIKAAWHGILLSNAMVIMLFSEPLWRERNMSTNSSNILESHLCKNVAPTFSVASCCWLLCLAWSRSSSRQWSCPTCQDCS